MQKFWAAFTFLPSGGSFWRTWRFFQILVWILTSLFLRNYTGLNIRLYVLIIFTHCRIVIILICWRPRLLLHDDLRVSYTSVLFYFVHLHKFPSHHYYTRVLTVTFMFSSGPDDDVIVGNAWPYWLFKRLIT